MPQRSVSKGLTSVAGRRRFPRSCCQRELSRPHDQPEAQRTRMLTHGDKAEQLRADEPADASSGGQPKVASEAASVAELLEKLDLVRQQLQQVIRGKADVIDSVLTSILAEGSVLLEDVPGAAKRRWRSRSRR